MTRSRPVDHRPGTDWQRRRGWSGYYPTTGPLSPRPKYRPRSLKGPTRTPHRTTMRNSVNAGRGGLIMEAGEWWARGNFFLNVNSQSRKDNDHMWLRETTYGKTEK